MAKLPQRRLLDSCTSDFKLTSSLRFRVLWVPWAVTQPLRVVQHLLKPDSPESKATKTLNLCDITITSSATGTARTQNRNRETMNRTFSLRQANHNYRKIHAYRKPKTQLQIRHLHLDGAHRLTPVHVTLAT